MLDQLCLLQKSKSRDMKAEAKQNLIVVSRGLVVVQKNPKRLNLVYGLVDFFSFSFIMASMLIYLIRYVMVKITG